MFSFSSNKRIQEFKKLNSWWKVTNAIEKVKVILTMAEKKETSYIISGNIQSM